MRASYQSLSYKSALDVWSSCERLVRLSRLLGSCVNKTASTIAVTAVLDSVVTVEQS